MSGRKLNFTGAELRDMLACEEVSLAEAVRAVGGIDDLRQDDELVRWDVPTIPCAEVPRVGPVDQDVVALRFGKRE